MIDDPDEQTEFYLAAGEAFSSRANAESYARNFPATQRDWVLARITGPYVLDVKRQQTLSEFGQAMAELRNSVKQLAQGTAQATAEVKELAAAAVASADARRDEDIDKWAETLADDVADADDPFAFVNTSGGYVIEDGHVYRPIRYQSFAAGAAVAFGLMGMAEAIRQRSSSQLSKVLPTLTRAEALALLLELIKSGGSPDDIRACTDRVVHGIRYARWP